MSASDEAPPSSVSVVVPTLEAGPRLARAIDSLGELGTGAELIVVDNASGDASLAELGRRAGVRVLAMERNTGFSHAVNRGAEAADGDVLVVLNDDCVAEPGFLGRLGRAVDPASSRAMAASVLLDPHDPARIESAGMELDRSLSVFDYMHGEPVTALAGAADPIGPSAAAAAFDRRTFLGAGGFDEGIFAYWEDVDLVLRLRLEGASCALAREARATHQLSATLGSGSATKNRLMGFGRGYVLRKWSVVSPTRLPAVALREAAICGGQLAIDRNGAGIGGRLEGWRAARPTFAYPRAVLAEHETPSVTGQLWRRLRRRLRSRGRPR